MMTPEEFHAALLAESERIRRQGEALILEADELLAALNEAAETLAESLTDAR